MRFWAAAGEYCSVYILSATPGLSSWGKEEGAGRADGTLIVTSVKHTRLPYVTCIATVSAIYL